MAISKNLRNASPGQDSIHATMLKISTLYSHTFCPYLIPFSSKLPILWPGKQSLFSQSSNPAPTFFSPLLSDQLLCQVSSAYSSKKYLINVFSGFWKLTTSSLPSSQYKLTKLRSTNPLFTQFFSSSIPRVWRSYIVRKLDDFGLRGNLPYILQSFLKGRKRISLTSFIFSYALLFHFD